MLVSRLIIIAAFLLLMLTEHSRSLTLTYSVVVPVMAFICIWLIDRTFFHRGTHA